MSTSSTSCDREEYVLGHVPGARNVPQIVFTARTLGSIFRKRRLCSCVRAACAARPRRASPKSWVKARSITSDGGTQRLRLGAGFPVERPSEPSHPAPSEAPSSPRGAAAGQADSSCGLPEPGLDAAVGANMRELRMKRNLTLDQLARITGLNRSLLGQIEIGKAQPNVNQVWRIAQAFDVQFSALLASAGSAPSPSAPLRCEATRQRGRTLFVACPLPACRAATGGILWKALRGGSQP